ncbi:hypothetical protein WA158_000885 [Blastocystis sp. Blastoise]
MSDSESLLTENKYLFTFQDETQLWISREFIEKYPQLPFHDIIQHSDKYEDGSYYIDMASSPIDRVVSFLNEEIADISSLNLRNSYDIYKTLHEYSITLDNEIQSDLFFHVKDLFIDYLKENNYRINDCYNQHDQLHMSMELFSSKSKEIVIEGLFTPQRKDELLYYSILIKMMNISEVFVFYDYSSDIPLEYVCPSSIKDIFPSLRELKISVSTYYKESEQLLNPNSDEYIMKYIRLFSRYGCGMDIPDNYNYFTESEMNEYNKKSTLNMNTIYYSHDMIDSYKKRRENNTLPKLYKYIVYEAIYNNDGSEAGNSKNTYGNFSRNDVNETNEKTFSIMEISSEWGITQLLRLISYFSISKIEKNYFDFQYDAMIALKVLKEVVFDSLTTLSVEWIEVLADKIDKNLFKKIITTHVFPNVTELIYDDPADTLEFLFPPSLISMIDTIIINEINSSQKNEIILTLDNLAYTHSIHIDGIVKIFCSEDVKKLDRFKNYIYNIDVLYITFKNYKEDEIRNSLERFLQSNILQHLNYLSVSFDHTISIEYLKWISNIFDDTKINTICELFFDLSSVAKDLSFEYLYVYENIIEKLIHKASIVTIQEIDDIPDDSFYELYTKNNFQQLTLIEFYIRDEKWWLHFIQKLCNYMNNNSFPSSSTIRLIDTFYYNLDYIYNPSTSSLQCKYDNDSFIDTIMCTDDETMNKYEIETLFDCIRENKTKYIRSLEIYIFDEEQLSELISFLTNGKIPKLKEFIFSNDISDDSTNIYKQQLNDSSFIKENHIKYELKKVVYIPYG